MMNKTKSHAWQKARFLLVIPAFALMTALFSFDAGKNQAEKLMGTWMGTNLEFEQSEGPDMKAMVEGGKALHVNGQLILHKDHRYEIKDPSGKVNGNGQWEYLSPQSFITTDSHGEKTSYEVVTLETNKLVTAHQVKLDTPEGMVIGKITLTYSR